MKIVKKSSLYFNAWRPLWLLSCLFLTHCSSSQKAQDQENFSVKEPTSGIETLAILGTNDIHGSLAPQILHTRETDGSKPIQYEAAGGATLASYIRILQKEYGDHLLWLDAGDEFQGSIESNLEQGAPMVQYFNLLNLDAAAVGNHEFDFGLETLKTRMSEAKYPYLTANILDRETHQLASFPNTYPRRMFLNGKIKVGVIGLSTLDTPKTTRAENVKNFQFEALKEATLHEAQILRQMGARIVLLTAHVGLKCSPGKLPETRILRRPSDPQGHCDNHDEMVQLLNSLPDGTVDAVVSGHSHQVVHHWIAGVPVIQGGAFGRYFNVIYLTYDWAEKKIIPEQTRIEGPVPVCNRVFQNQGDCNGDRQAPKNGRGPLVPVRFHGQMVQPDPKVSHFLTSVIQKSETKKKRVLGRAERPLENPRNRESPLGNLLADSIKIAAKTDFALVNSGGIRESIEAGPITFESVFRTMPFDNTIAVLTVTRDELKKILQVAESGSRGFPSVSGLQLRLVDPAYHAPYVDLDGSGIEDPWKRNRLKEVLTSEGRPLEAGRLYTLATLDFLATGGDDVGWAMLQIPADRVQTSGGILIRDALVKRIEELKIVNTSDQPLLDPQHPRLKFEKPSASQSSEKAPEKKRIKKRKKKRQQINV
jgi:5'-nucleotidase